MNYRKILVFIVMAFALLALAACDTEDEQVQEVTALAEAPSHTSQAQPETQAATEAETETATEPATEAIPFRHVNIPILMYHTSSEHNPGVLAELYVRPSEFERQIIWLIENDFTFVTFDDWDYLHTIHRPIMLTFDDGYVENYTEIFPILQRHNARIVLFLALNSIPNHRFSEEMIVSMHNSGLVSFESHTMTHPNLSNIADNSGRLRNELYGSRQAIEELTGRMPIALAYPAGVANAAVIEMVAEYYHFGLRSGQGMHNTEFDNFEIRRIRISRSTSLESFINLVYPR